ILQVAQHLNLPVDARSLRTPLVLTMDSAAAPAPGLHSDAELAGCGPSLLLLAMRLLLADAYNWPEQRFLSGGKEGDIEGAPYTLYAADPGRWTPESLAHELHERAHIEV